MTLRLTLYKTDMGKNLDLKTLNELCSGSYNAHSKTIFTEGIDNFPPPGVFKWYHWRRYGHKDSVSIMATASILSVCSFFFTLGFNHSPPWPSLPPPSAGSFFFCNHSIC